MSSTRRIGLGCMRLSTDPARDEPRALETLVAALEAGATLLDTAPSYGLGQGDEHHNERLVARALDLFSGDRSRVCVATKAGLVRRGSAWVPDGRARSLRASCLASLQALGATKLDLLWLHTPDPKLPLATSVRALEALRRDGLVDAIGLCNVSLGELEIARQQAPIAALQLSLGAHDDVPFRSGLVARARELGIPVYAHSPLGGPKRAARLGRDAELRAIAAHYDVSVGTLILAWLYGLGSIVPLPGARRVETARAAVSASHLALEAEHRERLDRRFPAAARACGRLRAPPRAPRTDAEIVLLMGVQAAGKSTHVRRFVEQGHERLNRDLRGGTLPGLAQELDRRLSAGGTRFVLDNTYLTRAARSHVIDVAREHGVPVRCIWLDTPLEQAQLNAVERLLDRHGKLPDPDELRALSRRDPNVFAPTVQLRALRELEPPSADEGFSAIEVVRFERRNAPDAPNAGVVIALEAALSCGSEALGEPEQDVPVLVIGWTERDWDATSIGARLERPVELALCPHGGGPPRCWCRPPLPGLIVPWARRHRVDFTRSRFVGTSVAERKLATTLGFSYIDRSGVTSGVAPRSGRSS